MKRKEFIRAVVAAEIVLASQAGTYRDEAMLTHAESAATWAAEQYDKRYGPKKKKKAKEAKWG